MAPKRRASTPKTPPTGRTPSRQGKPTPKPPAAPTRQQAAAPPPSRKPRKQKTRAGLPSATRPRARAANAPTRARAAGAVGPLTIEQQQAAFLEQFSAIGVINAACKLVGIDRMRHYDWLTDPRFPDYAERFARATQVAAEVMETAMVRRGVQGWDEPVYQGGVLVGYKRVFSDRLLEIGLKARLPEKYRERHEVQQTGPGGGPVQHEVKVTDADSMTDAQLAERIDLVKRSLAEPVRQMVAAAIEAKLDESAERVEAAKVAYAKELAERTGNGGNGGGGA